MTSPSWLLSIFSLAFACFARLAIASELDDGDCPCGELLERPELWKKALTARWMAHSLDWGVLTTFSSRTPGFPFGNVYSFVDGPCTNSTGTPYFYGTYMDQSFKDMKENPVASFTLSEASLASKCAGSSDSSFVQNACSISHGNHVGDPENPVCARLTITGTLQQVDEESEEYKTIEAAFFERHPQMAGWPLDHEWVIARLDIQDIWLIDYFGGATILDPEAYFTAKLKPKIAEDNV